jgi:hypothetical protein
MAKATTAVIQILVNQETDNSLVGKKCRIKPDVLEQYRANGCEPHADLCSGVLNIIATQKGWRGQTLVRVQNEKIKNLHSDCGDLLNSFPKELDEIELIED